MGARKRTAAEQRKNQTKDVARAVLSDCPTSPRKMRLVVDMIRGMEVNRALDVLRYSPKEASRKVEKLLLSAIANWQSKHEDVRIEKSNLFVKDVFVDGGRPLKRLRPAPQGRGYRIRKRSNHVTIVVDSLAKNEAKEESQTK